ncbi:MAG: cytochrome c family protein, partial [Pseudomonadota bacterium]|nr:cytochrome c family protein [Pseudomonadota bacterium]
MASDLQFNKYAGAILATGLGMLGLREISNIVYETEPPETMGYFIDAPVEAEGGGGPAADRPLDWGTLLPTANPADGAAVSKKCASCHTFERGGPNGTGPNLWGTLGGPIAAKAGFAYSDALKAYAGQVGGRWTYDELNLFLLAPARHVKGTKMTFVGLKKEDERVNLMAYMRTMTDAPPPIPAPDPSRQAGAAGTGGGPPADGASAASPVEGAAGIVPSPAGVTTGTPPTGAGGGAAGQTPIYGQP